MTDLVAIFAGALIPAAFIVGRYVEYRRWRRERELLDQVKAKAADQVTELRAVEAHTLRIVADQRDLIASFTSAADRMNHPTAGWLAREQIAWAAHRARTEVL